MRSDPAAGPKKTVTEKGNEETDEEPNVRMELAREVINASVRAGQEVRTCGVPV